MPTESESPSPAPGVFCLAIGDHEGLTRYLQDLGWIGRDDRVRSATKAGDGNMNCTLRVAASSRTLILKQARPWVEKYPHIAAPVERIAVEARFYELASTLPALAARMPQRLGFDSANGVLALEDLGEAQDLTSIYRGTALADSQIEELVDYLRHLHHAFVGVPGKAVFANRAMRQLNHRHIFVLPLAADSGIDLEAITPGLSGVAHPLRRDRRFAREVQHLGELYLGDGACLLHGDYFPGSWLSTGSGVRVIDPEFCFFGPPEFDLGVMLAHFHFAGYETECERELIASYGPGDLQSRLVRQFAGVEIMRRSIGVAQLPIDIPLERRAALLSLARRMVVEA